MLVGLLVLAGLGFGGAALFPDECAALERRGDLVLRYEGVAGALGVEESVGVELSGLGEAAGLGGFRGAVAVPDDATLLPAEAEFFVVTDDQFTVMRPGFGAISNARERDREQVVPAHRAIGIRAEDGTTVLYDGELDELRCGELVEPSRILDVDRGVSIVRDGDATAAVTLSGDRLWSRDLGGTPRWAWVVDRTVLVGTERGAVEVTLPEGDLLTELGGEPLDVLDALGSRVLAANVATGGLVLVDAELGATTDVPTTPVAVSALLPEGELGIGVADGRLVAAGSGVAGGAVDAPDGLRVAEVVTTDDGTIALLLELGARRAVLQWGPVPLLP